VSGAQQDIHLLGHPRRIMRPVAIVYVEEIHG
jgi:hypothetical protein